MSFFLQIVWCLIEQFQAFDETHDINIFSSQIAENDLRNRGIENFYKIKSHVIYQKCPNISINLEAQSSKAF